MFTNIFVSNTSKNNLIYIVALVLIIQTLLFSLVGCKVTEPNDYQQLPEEFHEYEYTLKEENVNIKQITLYYPDKDYENLVRVVNKVRVYEESNEISVIVNKWLQHRAGEDDNYVNAFNNKIGLEWVTVSRNLATINLIGQFDNIDDLVFYSGVVALVNTVCELKHIDYVEILINGKQLPNAGLLKTPMTKVDEKLKLSYLEHQNAINNVMESVSTRENTIFYFLCIKSNYLIADVSNVTIAKDNAIEEIFSILKSGPNYDSGMKSCIPQSVMLNSEEINVENDETVLTLHLESSNFETFDNRTRYMLCGGLTLTMLSYFREVDAVRILINEQPVLDTQLLKRDYFKVNIGHLVSLYMPNKDYSLLIEVQTAVNQDNYNNPWQIINEMINYERSYYNYTRVSFPPNITEEDILGVVVYDNCCIINMSENLLNRLKNVSQKQQRLFVYSIVNTLTQLDNVNSVQFVVDGMVYEKISDSIYIETPIIKNPDILFE